MTEGMNVEEGDVEVRDFLGLRVPLTSPHLTLWEPLGTGAGRTDLSGRRCFTLVGHGPWTKGHGSRSGSGRDGPSYFSVRSPFLFVTFTRGVV